MPGITVGRKDEEGGDGVRVDETVRVYSYSS